ncbi:MAG: hypothetical protein NUV86_08980 [Candidatus Scalindua sp.]|nr:hypothetical protein [Candidatus Scalindua sp.]MCR4343894.1 hypothetical protein [Candidatus Scalindua sp.]
MKKILIIISFLAVMPLLACSCAGLSREPVSGMPTNELSSEYEILSKKLDREDAMFTAYEWNRFMGRQMDLGMELSNRDYWSIPTLKLSGQNDSKQTSVLISLFTAPPPQLSRVIFNSKQ